MCHSLVHDSGRGLGYDASGGLGFDGRVALAGGGPSTGTWFDNEGTQATLHVRAKGNSGSDTLRERQSEGSS